MPGNSGAEPYQPDTEAPTTPRIIPGDAPAYVPTGEDNGIMLLSEYSRPVYVDCERCRKRYDFKLLSDELLTIGQCDRVLETYLRDEGWRIGTDDICPSCHD